jgi:hypothetical protein
LGNPNHNKNDGEVDNEYYMKIYDYFNIIDEPYVHAPPNIAGCIRQVGKSKQTATQVIMNHLQINPQETGK